MKIYSVHDKEFIPYGEVIAGYDTAEMVNALDFTFSEQENVSYVPFENNLEGTKLAKEIESNIFGGMKTQIGCCWGKNTKLNCLEYHRTSEINLGSEDFILLLALESELKDGTLDTSKVKAFLCPKGVMINVYATTLHFAPCSAKNGAMFRTMVALPAGTNTEYKPEKIVSFEDKLLFARNKWLIAHKESTEASKGAFIGLIGENIDIKNNIE